MNFKKSWYTFGCFSADLERCLTNLTADTRRKLIALFESYKARVRIVYLETDWQTQVARNASRPDQVPTSVIASMLAKLTPPEAHEAAKVEWITI